MPPTHPGVHPPIEFHGMPMVFSTWPCHGRPPCHPPIQESPMEFHGMPMVFSTWSCHGKPPCHPPIQESTPLPHGIPWDAHGVLHMALPLEGLHAIHPSRSPPMEFHGMPMVFSTWPCHGRPPCHPPIQESTLPWNSMGCPWCSPHGLAMEGLHAIHPSRSPLMEFHGMPMVFSTWSCHPM